jgi:hypothetical protein
MAGRLYLPKRLMAELALVPMAGHVFPIDPRQDLFQFQSFVSSAFALLSTPPIIERMMLGNKS